MPPPAAPTPTGGTPPAPSPGAPPPASKKRSLDEVVTSIIAVVGTIFTALTQQKKIGEAVSAGQEAVANAADDFGFFAKHGLIVALRFVAGIWLAYAAWFYYETNISRFAGIHNTLRVIGFLWILHFIYLLPVRWAGFLAHARYRSRVQKWAREVERLKQLTSPLGPYHGDPNTLAALGVAEIELQRAKDASDAFVKNQGANNRNPLTNLVINWLLGASFGLMAILHFMRLHSAGVFTYEEIFPDLVRAAILSVLMFPLPQALLDLACIPLFFVFDKVERLAKNGERGVHAAVRADKEIGDLITDEKQEAKELGDDFHLSAAQIFNVRRRLIQAAMLTNYGCAVAVMLQHGLIEASTRAFLRGVALSVVALIYRMHRVDPNSHKKDLPLDVTLLSGTVALPYVNEFVVGGHGGRLSWWWDPRGPFSFLFNSADQIAETADTAVNTAAPVAYGFWDYVMSYVRMGVFGLFGLALLVALGLGLAHFFGQKTSASLQKVTDNDTKIWLRRVSFVGIGIVVIAAALQVFTAAPKLQQLNEEATRTFRRENSSSSSNGETDCPRDPRGGDRPACIRRCFVNSVPPDDMQAARANGLCFDP